MENVPNPKRTVTIQMMQQLASIDALGNKELNGNWDIEPKLNQDCSSAQKAKSDQEHMHLTPSDKDSKSHTKEEKNIASHGCEDHRQPQNSHTSPKTSGLCTKSTEYRINNCKSNSNSESLTVLSAKSPSSSPSSTVTQSTDKEKNGNSTTKALEKMTKPLSITSETSAIKGTVRNQKPIQASPPNHSNSDGASLEKDLSPSTNNTKKDISLLSESKDSNCTTSIAQESTISRTQFEQLQVGSTTNALKNNCSRVTDEVHSTAETFQPAHNDEKEDNCVIDCMKEDSTPPGTSRETPSGHLLVSSRSNAMIPDNSSHSLHMEVTSMQGAALEEQKQVDCKLYREASTMTSAVEFSNQPSMKRHDVEVQAVALVCSQSTATSPSLLPLQPHQRSIGLLPEETESLGVVFGIETTDRTSGATSEIHTNTPTVVSSSTILLEKPTQSDTVMVHVDADLQWELKLGAMPGSCLPNSQRGFSPLHPVYQINIETCNQNKYCKEERCSLQSHGSPALSGTGPQNSASVQDKTSDHACQNLPEESAKPPASISVLSQSEIHPQVATSSEKPPSDITMATPPTSSSTPQSKKQQGASKLKPEKEEQDDEKAAKETKKSVHDVIWDEQGMTWEVYGASVDPESLGFAIQSHLQCKIIEHEKKVMVQTALRKSLSLPPGKKNKRRHVNINFRSMFQNIRRPICCGRPSVLE